MNVEAWRLYEDHRNEGLMPHFTAVDLSSLTTWTVYMFDCLSLARRTVGVTVESLKTAAQGRQCMLFLLVEIIDIWLQCISRHERGLRGAVSRPRLSKVMNEWNSGRAIPSFRVTSVESRVEREFRTCEFQGTRHRLLVFLTWPCIGKIMNVS
jgi:hypothetical protein